MSTEQVDRETLAEVLSWASGEMTRYRDDAAPDYKRWSWRGDGHGQALREAFRSEADAVLASDWLAEVKRAEREAGAREALLSAADDFGHMWQADTVPALVVYQALRDRAAALGTGEEGQG